jgi:hypothetical protein
MCPFSNVYLTPKRKALLEREEQCTKHVDQNVSDFSFFVCHFSKVIGSKGAEQENKAAAIWILSWTCFG